MPLRREVEGHLDLLALHRRHPRRYPFLLESAADHPRSGRYDLLFAFPSEARVGASSLFAQLAADWERARVPNPDPEHLPFIGGWFLLLGYEAAAVLEPRLRLPESPYALPDALAVRCPAAVIRDRLMGRITLIAEHDAAQLDQLERDVEQAGLSAAADSAPFVLASLSEDAPERYTQGVQRIQEYLRAGDAFQVNLSRGWRGRIAQGDAADLYAQLRRRNPAPFAGIACWEGSAVVSSSPERLVSVSDGWVQTRPIAGTRPRSADAHADLALKGGLMRSLKERAEHVMLLDLERNDLGRVSVPGTVEVDELMCIESYAHVHHIVSNVRGRLRDDQTPIDALRAVFPGGTITGCPKLRVMEIIAELEGEGRGPYTGAMGYLSRCGRMDSNILIRSLIVEGERLAFRAGGGIVADSRPEAELGETRAKARGLLAALGVVA